MDIKDIPNKIPSIIHQIWIQGLDKVPPRLRKYHEDCEDINNNFVHQFWDEKRIMKLLKKTGSEYVDLYNYYDVPAQKADVARYVILYHYGGIYLDMDIICRKNMTPFLKYGFFTTTDIMHIFYRRYMNGMMGASKGHLVFQYVFKNLFKRKTKDRTVTYTTGVRLLYDSVQEYIKDHGKSDIEIVDRKYLHPCNTYNSDDCWSTCTDCYVAHVNLGSWNSSWSNFLNKYIIKKLKLILILFFVIIFVILILKAKDLK